ncbi:sigma-70 family RNA polymerase sigma factor [Methylobacterium sp. J-067]|uniref:sigma-70 family RNA polymerase sigma factor n=1 Tax=Methylobacterium sp. J-067 TaxID=2836648 RepID=UPI001FB8E3BE|nr:sigma-70 family RNA polymerase sigma factor [Methylobacterium sp. J-067]MCJ2026467.1 hypothetical protein [Methylobacterium sp. J-067]
MKDAEPTRGPMQGLRDVDYLAYRPVLLRMLSSLARNGYAVSPDDGLDLVHDFFIEAWTGVVHRHDPHKSPFPAFLNHTFLAFARPRIIRLKRWRTTLLDPADMARLQDVRHVVVAEREHVEQILLVRAVVQSMAPKDRKLFQCYLSGDGSEREIATRFGLTRYALRSRLVDLFGEFAARFGHLSNAPMANNLVVDAIWHRHRTPKEAASFLRIPVPEVQAARTRMYSILVAAVKGGEMMEPISFYVSGTPKMDTPDAEQLLRRAIAAGPEDRDRAIADVRRNAAAILDFLESPDWNESFPGGDEELLAQIYLALAGEREMDVEPSPVVDAYLKAISDEEIVIGQAFKQALLANLHNDLLDADRVFEGLPKLDVSEYRHLISNASVENGGAFARDLAMYGVTPANVLEASLSIARLARRKVGRAGGASEVWLTLGARPDGGPLSINRDELRDAVATVTDLHEDVSDRLACWLLEVAAYVPLLFDMFRSEPIQNGVRLILTDRRENDLYVRWNGTVGVFEGRAEGETFPS